MKEFKTGDVVKIVKQPENQIVNLVGERAVVEEIICSKEHPELAIANVNSMKINGYHAGWGSVSIDCLEMETDPAWLEAAKVYPAYLEKDKIRKQKVESWFDGELSKISAIHKIDPRVAESFFFDMLSAWHDYQECNAAGYEKLIRETFDK